MPLKALPRHTDGLRQVALLPQLFGQLGEEPGPRILLDPFPEVVDSGVAGQRNL
jgi:hypothetical protein